MKSQLITKLEELGVRINWDHHYEGEGKDRHEIKDETIQSVFVPLTPVHWVNMCMGGDIGEHYIGGCCGNLSQAQDIVSSVFREGGWFTSHHLAELGVCLEEHEGFEKWKMTEEEALKLAEDWKTIQNPWDRFAIVWAAVKHLVESRNDRFRIDNREELTDIQKLSILANGLTALSWSDLFRDVNKDNKQHGMNRKLLIARLAPGAKALLQIIKGIGVVPVFALVNKENGRVLENGYGLALFDTREDAEKLRKDALERGDLKGTGIEIKEGTLSAEMGLELK